MLTVLYFLRYEASDSFRWEERLPLKGDIYNSAIKHLKSKGFCEKAKKFGADALGREIRKAALKPFLGIDPTEAGNFIVPYVPKFTQERVTRQPEEHLENDGTRVQWSTSSINRNSISALLNPEEPPYGQYSPSVSSALQASNGVLLVAGERTEVWSGGKID
ncbi:hypothetical protein BOTCAL_0526g00040 [Botryotinia calthae]|uniref:Uncharacterized protein n=1 Tax=Botryotinia calthae TaxID=38488 RepID=A0A4Y8CNB6_9HELO|nr:hypothetical protein BOTCAL_0526g00040 [Botryotinia calthae]